MDKHYYFEKKVKEDIIKIEGDIVSSYYDEGDKIYILSNEQEVIIVNDTALSRSGDLTITEVTSSDGVKTIIEDSEGLCALKLIR